MDISPEELDNEEVIGTSRRDPIHWNEHLEAVLLANCLKHRIHLKTDRTIEEKWSGILFDLAQHASFKPLVNLLSASGLKKKYLRLKNFASKKYALEQEGSNLSALSENIPPNELLLINMITEHQKFKGAKIADKEKKRRKNAQMLAHEESVLQGSSLNIISSPVSTLKDVSQIQTAEASSTTDSIPKISSASVPRVQSFQDRFFQYKEERENRRLEIAERARIDAEKYQQLEGEIQDLQQSQKRLKEGQDEALEYLMQLAESVQWIKNQFD
jgi:hypothetical protein